MRGLVVFVCGCSFQSAAAGDAGLGDGAAAPCDAADPTLIACYLLADNGDDGSMYGNNADPSSVLLFAQGYGGETAFDSSGTAL